MISSYDILHGKILNVDDQQVNGLPLEQRRSQKQPWEGLLIP